MAPSILAADKQWTHDTIVVPYPQEAEEYVSIGTLNGLFVFGRTCGFIGHYLDQKRLKQGLYRHPWDDISYISMWIVSVWHEAELGAFLVFVSYQQFP